MQTQTAGMTWGRWQSMSQQERELARDYTGLTPELSGHEGWRVEVLDHDGNTRRFNVGKSTGWKPCHLEVYNARSMGGGPADSRGYASVRRIRRVAS